MLGRLAGGREPRRAKVSASDGGGGSSSSTAIVPARRSGRAGAPSGSSASAAAEPWKSDIDKRKNIDDAMSLFGARKTGAEREEEQATVMAEKEVEKFVYGIRRGAEDDEKLSACMELAKFVNGAYGFEASALGLHLRRSKGLAFILQLLYEGDAPLQRIGLMVMSNLVSDAFDPRSHETKRQVLHAGVFERIKDFVYSADGVAQTYACACLQNLCKDVAFAKLLRSYELVEELERLVKVSPNEHLRKFAAGALFNTVEAIHRDFVAASLDDKEKEDAGDDAKLRKKPGVLSHVCLSTPPAPLFTPPLPLNIPPPLLHSSTLFVLCSPSSHRISPAPPALRCLLSTRRRSS